MDVARPTVAPPGRLVRLGVVLDTRNPIERLVEVARMCDRAGIGALWVEDPAEEPLPGAEAPAGGARLDAWTALALLAGEVHRARIGAVLDAGAWSPGRLARMAATIGALTGGRLELTLRASESTVGAAARALREALVATTVPAVLDPAAAGAAPGPAAFMFAAGGPAYGAVALPAEPVTIGVQVEPAAAAPPRAAATVPPEPGAGGLAAAVADADDLVLPTGPLAATLAAATAARQAAGRAGRGPATLGVAARLPVSVGRTLAEAQARWEAEPAFAALGGTEEAGLLGTLEQCQDRVVALAHAGVSDLRCLLPNAIDIHDVIAQLTAMTIGTADKLVPGAPRTRVPEPPPGWGGRSRFPKPS